MSTPASRPLHTTDRYEVFPDPSAPGFCAVFIGSGAAAPLVAKGLTEDTAHLLANALTASGRLDAALALNADLLKALEVAASVISTANADYNHPRFTDRHGDGPRFRAALEVVRQAIAAATRTTTEGSK